MTTKPLPIYKGFFFSLAFSQNNSQKHIYWIVYIVLIALSLILTLTLQTTVIITCSSGEKALIFYIKAAGYVINPCRNNVPILFFLTRSLYRGLQSLEMVYSKITLIYTVL